ncbi:MAG: DUF6364 family protein [Thermotogota bacterium]
MNTKLTLRLDEDLIRRAKRFSGTSGKSLSKLVADYFALIETTRDAEDGTLPPKVRSLLGALAPLPGTSAVNERDYRRHLEEKHR